MIIFESLLTTFEATIIFEAAMEFNLPKTKAQSYKKI